MLGLLKRIHLLPVLFVAISAAASYVLAQRFFYVGDSVDDERGFETRVGKPLLRDSDDDPVLANRLEPTPRNGTGSGDPPGPRRSACWKLFPPDRTLAFPPNPARCSRRDLFRARFRRAADFHFPHGHWSKGSRAETKTRPSLTGPRRACQLLLGV
jgi:hypothetical protein